MGLYDVRKFDVTLRVEIDNDENDSEENILSYLEGLDYSYLKDVLLDISEN
jgi:hypothetical protein